MVKSAIVKKLKSNAQLVRVGVTLSLTCVLVFGARVLCIRNVSKKL